MYGEIHSQNTLSLICMEKFISLKEMSLIRLEHISLTYDGDASAITPEAQIVILGDLETQN